MTVTAKCFRCDWGMTHNAATMPQIASGHIRECLGPVVIQGAIELDRISPPHWTIYERGAAAGSGTTWCAVRTIPLGKIKAAGKAG